MVTPQGPFGPPALARFLEQSMHSPWFNISVLALWLATMSWLVVEKILPSVMVGDPPDRVATLAAQTEDELVGYEVRWQKERIGHAVIGTKRKETGATLVDGQIHFDRLPIRQMLPKVLVDLFGVRGSIPETIDLDAKNRVLFHSNGRVQRFNSTVHLDESLSTIQVEGFVAGETLLLTVRSAGVTYETRRPLPLNAMLSNGLMPQSRMPGLYRGRKWTVEVYSPIRPRTETMEIMQAEVVGRDLIPWGGKFEHVWLVVYRGDPGGDISHAGKERVWLWVRDDGVVLQHRITVLDGSLTFVRMQDEEAPEFRQMLRDPTAEPVSEATSSKP